MSNDVLSDALASNYMLVSLQVPVWQATKNDRAAAKKLAEDMGASEGAARVTTELLHGAKKELKAVQSAYTAIRSHYYAHTLPWTTTTEGARKGDRLLAVTESMRFLSEFATMKANAEAQLQEFVTNHYEPAKVRAQMNLGSLWNEKEYPTADQVKSLFGAHLSVRPMPAVTDFDRLAIPGKLADGLKAIYAKHATTQISNALKDLQQRIMKELVRFQGMMERLATGDKPRLYNSLITNPQQLVLMCRSLNLTNDPLLDAFADDMTNRLLNHKLDDYRDNAALARSAASVAEEMLERARDSETFGLIGGKVVLPSASEEEETDGAGSPSEPPEVPDQEPDDTEDEDVLGDVDNMLAELEEEEEEDKKPTDPLMDELTDDDIDGVYF